METLVLVVLIGFAALSLIARAAKDIRVIRNKVVTWRGIEYRNGDKRDKRD